MRGLKVLGFVTLAMVLGSPAFADDQCPKLTLISSMNMHIGKDGRVYVPATINGVPKSMLIDTGGFFTEITQAAVDEMKLNTHHVGLELVGASGETTEIATRTSFKLGSLTADGMDFMVMPGANEFASDVPDAAGIVAPNLLRLYDLDLDFGDGKVNLISQDHCDGKVVYWPATIVAVVPMHLNASHHIVIPITLDGHPLNAMLDTGATETLLNLGTAEIEFGIQPGGPDTPAVGRLNGRTGPAVYSHRFKSLELAGIAVGNPELGVIPDLMGPNLEDPTSSIEHGTRIPDKDVETGLPQVILGMDVLRRLHVYIAYKEQKLYITPAVPSSGAASAAAASPAH